MKYFKRKDGSVFGKVDSISKNVIDGFIKKGYKECDEDGKVIIKKKKEKSKKKWHIITLVGNVNIGGLGFIKRAIKLVALNAVQRNGIG